MRRRPLLLATLLVTALAVVATPATAGSCERINLETNPYLPGDEYGEAEICDEDNNGQPDTATLETTPVYSDSEVGITQERRTYPGGQDEDVRVDALISLGTPLSPAIHTEAAAENDGDDSSIDTIDHQGGVFLGGPVDRATTYYLGLWDLDSDGTPDAWGVLLCATDAGCDAPGLDDLPDPDPNQLPEPVVELPIVGYVP